LQSHNIRPIIKKVVEKNSIFYTDEYVIYDYLNRHTDYEHKTVNHSAGEYALSDGTHVNTMEGCWSLLRPWIRSHRGINKQYLKIYVGLAEFLHNRRLISAWEQIKEMISQLLTPKACEVKKLYGQGKLATLCSV
jgi:transposase-like protein